MISITLTHLIFYLLSQPPPPPKQETKWEKFAKAKGIPLNKEKRSRKVWDETTGTWMYRHGFEKANSKAKEWPIMEVKGNEDPYADPWEKIRDAKRARTDRNIESRMKNQERAGFLAKGVTNRVMKARESSRKNAKLAGNKDRDNVPPTGVPVDLKSGSGDARKRGKISTNAALEVVQRSTASMGKFDKMREGEPERKKVLSKTKKRKFESNTSKSVASSEGQKSMKILNAVMNGGGVEKAKAIRKGKYAKGETAYDYDYDDGLGASSFKKKKVSEGIGEKKIVWKSKYYQEQELIYKILLFTGKGRCWQEQKDDEKENQVIILIVIIFKVVSSLEIKAREFWRETTEPVVFFFLSVQKKYYKKIKLTKPTYHDAILF